MRKVIYMIHLRSKISAYHISVPSIYMQHQIAIRYTMSFAVDSNLFFILINAVIYMFSIILLREDNQNYHVHAAQLCLIRNGEVLAL